MYLKQIGKVTIRGNETDVVDFTLNSSIDKLTTKGELKVSRYRWNRLNKHYFISKDVYENNEIQNIVKRGDLIKVEFGYVDYPSFKGEYFVTKVRLTKTFIHIEFEDYMYKLKSANNLVNVSYKCPSQGGSGGQSDLLQFIKEGIEEEHKDVKVHILPESLKYPINKYTFKKMTWAEILDYIRKTHLISSYFIGKTLIISLIYSQTAINNNFDIKYGEFDADKFRYSFVSNNLQEYMVGHEVQYFDEITVKMTGKNFTKNDKGKTIVKTYSTIFPKTGGEVDKEIDVVFYKLSQVNFEKTVDEMAQNNNLSGFLGEFTIFGELKDSRYIQITDAVTLIDARFADVGDTYENDSNTDNDLYLVAGVKITYNKSGIRQVIELGRKIIG